MDFVTLNRPIGYSKLPLKYGSASLSTPLNENNNSIGALQVSFDLINLPIEIIGNIINYLSQFDILSLCRTCHKMHELCNSRLYNHIIIDSQFNIFNNEYRINGKTYINSSFNLKRFIKVFNKSHHDHHIYSFHCKNLPDSLDIYDYNLNQDLILLFSKLNHLQSLIWLDDNFRLDFLYNLPQKQLLTTLILNLKFSNYLSEINQAVDFGDFQKLKFPNLVNFQIKPFKDSAKLRQIVDNLLINDDDPSRVGERLRQLSFSGQNQSVYVVRTLFLCTRLRHLPELTSLALNDMVVSIDDAKLLTQSVDLSKLKFLQLKRITEIEHDQRQSSFLLNLRGKFKSLCHLSLNVQEHRDTAAQFIQNLPPLTSLDIITSTNQHTELAECIVKHCNLKKLSIVIYKTVDDLLYEDIHSVFYDSLVSLNLTSLRINNTSNIQGLVHLVSSQKQLKFLDLLGAKAGGAPNLGLGMIHPTVFDEWFKVQHVVLFYLTKNRAIEYIRIGDCIFQCKSDLSVNPRGGLNDWFDERVRVFATLGL
ncbi:hypothetical protein CANMA_001654 [Candida margitis]|uniref:uncharacterized protein n=1 Tax=Candida margitis TaxID=1775924 RepID=UPI002227615E|nr:uncharacterized protein CANMA_001654 [Candida margitis]KAI5969334.1 hypothetical protein CANMA_001654 [Candida margitis]